jgi:hypothetical protein
MSASPPGYYLLALKMKEDFLARQPLSAPRISWSVHRLEDDWLTLVMGGQAPDVASRTGARRGDLARIVANIRADA